MDRKRQIADTLTDGLATCENVRPPAILPVAPPAILPAALPAAPPAQPLMQAVSTSDGQVALMPLSVSMGNCQSVSTSHQIAELEWDSDIPDSLLVKHSRVDTDIRRVTSFAPVFNNCQNITINYGIPQ